MNSTAWPTQADLGGRGGFGPVLIDGTSESEGELWHAPWEPRALAVTLAAGAMGEWNIDMSRAARETLPDYARLSYYEIWVLALERLLLQRGLVQAGELQAGELQAGELRAGELRAGELQAGQALPARPAAKPVARVLRADAVAAALARGSPTERPPPAGAAARYAVGDVVRTSSAVPPHHTRLPGYARGKLGTVQAVRGWHVFADTHAQGLGEQPQWLYTVVFSGVELWGDGLPGAHEARGTRVSIDAWEPYLEPAAGSPVQPRAPNLRA